MNQILEKSPAIKTPEKSGGGLDVLPNSISSIEKVVGPPQGSGGDEDQTVVTSQTSGLLEFAFGDRIRRLLFQPKNKTLQLPSPKVQKVKVRRALIKETEKLLKHAEKIQKKRKFSAYKLERVIEKIRFLQDLLEEIVSATVDRIERLYRQYILKIS